LIWNARLLALSPDEAWTQRLERDLNDLGWRTITAMDMSVMQTVVSDFNIEVILIDERILAAEPQWIQRLQALALSKRLVVFVMREQLDFTKLNGFENQFLFDVHAQQIVLRAEHCLRSTLAEVEFQLRCETFIEQGLPVPKLVVSPRPLKILSLGQPDPGFLSLNHALEALEVEVIAAFSSYSAFDFMHEQVFDAVLLRGGGQPQEALAVIKAMRRNTRLYHTPVVLRLRGKSDLDFDEDSARGVTDLSFESEADTDLALRLIGLAKAFRRQTALREGLDGLRHHVKMDSESGLFSLDLFAAHLARLAKDAALTQRPLSLCVLKMNTSAEISQTRTKHALAKAIPQISAMISRLVRSEDTAGRLSSEIFVLALPATSLIGAQNVGERIAAIIGCTAFEIGAGRSPFVVEFNVGAAQILDNESPSQALTRAANMTEALVSQMV
jgi:two-component system, cell cycle response regulator PopA